MIKNTYLRQQHPVIKAFCNSAAAQNNVFWTTARQNALSAILTSDDLQHAAMAIIAEKSKLHMSGDIHSVKLELVCAISHDMWTEHMCVMEIDCTRAGGLDDMSESMRLSHAADDAVR